MVCSKCNAEIPQDENFLYNSEFSCPKCGYIIKSISSVDNSQGMKTRQEIKAQAKAAFIKQYGTAILLVLIYTVFILIQYYFESISENQIYDATPLFLAIPLLALIIVIIINMTGEFFKIYNNEKAAVGMMFSGLKINFFRKLGGMLWMILWIYIWMLLLIIPGIVKYFAYYFTSYILAVHPKVTALEAIKISMRITQGYKWEIFIFTLSWLGWLLLSVLTCGILYLLYVGPYYLTAEAGLFYEMRNKALADGRITHEELGMEKESRHEIITGE
ncbi:MAG: DUF975 family protein [Treponema sp.]|nr:DUF975 family protein [Treponema sp.]